jgi:RimJ/RimL family protein N-acetyltransferase
MEPLYEEVDEERAYARDYIEKVYAFYDFGIWTVVEKTSGEVIGRAGICYREGYEDPELGFMIGVPWQGKGLATEVCRAVLA